MADCNYDTNNNLVCKYNPIAFKDDIDSEIEFDETKFNEDFENSKIKSKRLSFIKTESIKNYKLIDILFGMKDTVFKLFYKKNLNKEFLYEDRNMFHIGVFLLVCVLLIQYIRIFI